jgi:hypothetical protein
VSNRLRNNFFNKAYLYDNNISVSSEEKVLSWFFNCITIYNNEERLEILNNHTPFEYYYYFDKLNWLEMVKKKIERSNNF